MLVSGSAQAPAAGVAGPAQPTEVGLRARVSFDLPSSPSPVDPALGKGLKEEGDSVVSIPQLRTGLSLTLPLSFVPIIESHLPSPLLAPFCRFGASKTSSGSTPRGQSRPLVLNLFFHLSPTASLLNVHHRRCGGGEGVCCTASSLSISFLGHPPGSLHSYSIFTDLAGCDLFVFFLFVLVTNVHNFAFI